MVRDVTASGYGSGSGLIWMDGVRCDPYKHDDLSACFHNGFGNHDCTHSRDVGVQCEHDRCKLFFLLAILNLLYLIVHCKTVC